MFQCTRTETRLFMEGKSGGVVRKYGGDCPHKAGNDIVLTSKYLPWTGDDGKSVPFAKGVIVSVRPGTVARFRKDKMIAQTDGFGSPPAWHGHLNMLYQGIRDDESVHHITIRIDAVDKDPDGEVQRELSM